MKISDPFQLVRLPVDTSCVVQAGPGCRKTWLLIERLTWLMSQELRPHSTVSCITYTNAAADEIAARLPSGVMPGFLGTIHSFLLKYVLYPYGHLLGAFPANWDLVTQGYAKPHVEWMAANGHIDRRKAFIPEVVRAFEAVGYDRDGTLRDLTGTRLKPEEMRQFVARRLSQGQVSQADVLWFSYRVLSDLGYAHVCNALSCRFASILVDEFQDTTELQNAVLEKLHGLKRTSLFLVGDPDQSVFSFAGASLNTFRNCTTLYPTYEFTETRRFTQRIADFLNEFLPSERTLHTTATWKDFDIPIYVLVGRILNAERLRLFHVLQRQHDLSSETGKSDYFVLARGRELMKELARLEGGGAGDREDLLNALEEKHPLLHSITESVLQAMKYKQLSDMKKAYLRLDQALSRLILKANAGFGDPSDLGLTREGWRLVVISVLHRLDAPDGQDVRSWVKQLKTTIGECIVLAGGQKSGPKLRLLDSFGKVLKKRSIYPMNMAVDSVALPDEVKMNVRTIHAAKGLERDAVLVIAATPQQFSRWVKLEKGPSIRDEEARIGYVAFSRAKKLLCVATDSLTAERRAWLESVACVKLLDGHPPQDDACSITQTA